MPPELNAVPTCSSGLFSPEWVLDPYPTIEEIRSLGPVVYDEANDLYVVTGYRDCAKILGNARVFDQEKRLFFTAYGGTVMEGADNPLHNQMRSLIQDDFRPDAVPQYKEMLIRVVAEQLEPAIQRLRAGEEIEAIAGLCRDLPIYIIAEILGWRLEDIPLILELSEGIGKIFRAWHDDSPEGKDRLADGAVASKRLNEYVRNVIGERQANPADDLVTRMLQHPNAQYVSPTNMIAQISQLVFAGHETTAMLSGHILMTLAKHPEQLRLLREDRSLVPAAIEEVHRWSPPIMHNFRHVLEDCTVAGYPIPKGATVMVNQAAAARDPERWENPSAFDVTRPTKPHLGFSFGMHMCVGMHLARLEMQVWLNRLLDEFEGWEITSDIEWGPTGINRGPQSMNIKARAASAD